jgi:hypothetical protein
MKANWTTAKGTKIEIETSKPSTRVYDVEITLTAAGKNYRGSYLKSQKAVQFSMNGQKVLVAVPAEFVTIIEAEIEANGSFTPEEAKNFERNNAAYDAYEADRQRTLNALNK